MVRMSVAHNMRGTALPAIRSLVCQLFADTMFPLFRSTVCSLHALYSMDVVTGHRLDLEVAWHDSRDSSERNFPMAKYLGVVIVGLVIAFGFCGVAPTGADDAASEALPVAQIAQIIGAEGHVSHGVLSIDITREDIGDVPG